MEDKEKKPESNKAEEAAEQETKINEVKEKKSVEKSKEKRIKTEKNKKLDKAIKPKKEAIAKGKDLPISTLQANAICRFIKNKKIEEAISLLEKVSKKKIAVPFKGEIPHRKGMMSGRFPIKASGYFIKILKCLSANASVNGLDLEKIKISAISNKASRPYKRFGSERFKRSNIIIKAK